MSFKPGAVRYDFDDQLAIVAGGASGIGRAVVDELLRSNTRVAFLDIDSYKGLEKMQDAEVIGKVANFFYADIADSAQVNKSIDAIVQTSGLPSFLVNVAGIEYFNKGNLITMEQELADRIIDVNLKGYLNTLRAVVPLMEENGGGRIVLIGSGQAYSSCPPATTYQLTKCAALPIARNIALDYARKNIIVNVVQAGATATEGIGAERDEEALKQMKDVYPLGRRAHPSEIAEVVLFLLSEGSSYMVASGVDVTGGELVTHKYGGWGVPEPPVENDPDA